MFLLKLSNLLYIYGRYVHMMVKIEKISREFFDLYIFLILRRREGALCFEWGFTRTFPRNQDASVKLKSELISRKF